MLRAARTQALSSSPIASMSEEPRETGPIDTDLLDRIAAHLARSDRFETVDSRPPYAPSAVVAAYQLGYFPNGVTRASLRIRWFETDDFSIQYLEEYHTGTTWACRWDRHPNGHNSREHVHPPPDASTPGLDAAFSDEWRAVITTVLGRLDERIEAFWQDD